MTLTDFAALKTLSKTDPNGAISTYEVILSKTDNNEQSLKEQEQAIIALGKIFHDLNQPQKLAQLIRQSKPLFGRLTKARTATVIKTLVDCLIALKNSLPLQLQICRELVQDCVEEKRVYLKQSLETKLIALMLQAKLYSDALLLIADLLRELKRMDDKMMLVHVHLLESQVYFALKNVPKSRAALTAAKTSANAVYCPPLTQAALDMQSGILHAEEKDFKTAYSYFYETLEGYSSQDDPRALNGLKYMLLCKIMLNSAEDVQGILFGKLASRYSDGTMAMKAIALAHQHRSLQEFEQALKKYDSELAQDLIIQSHLNSLYDTLLEQNLSRVIEPFSRVEIAHVAELVKLPVNIVEKKLSQMILDKVFHGILDQGAGCLEVFEESASDKTYEKSLETIKQMGNVVESLYHKASKLK